MNFALSHVSAHRSTCCRSKGGDLESFIKVKRVVRCHDREVVGEGLRDDLSIERVRVMGRQIEQVKAHAVPSTGGPATADPRRPP